MKRETSNGNAYLANCPIPADSIIILIFYTFIRQPWFKRLIFLSHIERTFHFKSWMFKVVLPWCCNGRKRQMREILAAWFCLCTAVRSRRLEILLWDLGTLSRAARATGLQFSSEGLENLAECKSMSLDLELDWAEWKCSERGASSQLQPIEISLTSWLLGTICRKCNCTRVNVAEHQKVHFAAIAATFSVTRATPRATEFFSSPLLRPHAHCQSGWAQVKLCPTLLLHWHCHTLSFLLNSKFIQMHLQLQQELFTIYAIRGCTPSAF